MLIVAGEEREDCGVMGTEASVERTVEVRGGVS